MGKSSRRDPRINIALDIKLSVPGGFEQYQTKNISYRGLFIVSDDPLPLRRLARMSLTTQSGELIEVMGLIAHRINGADAAERGILAGMGIQIFPVGSQVNELWRDYITAQLDQDPALRQAVHDHNLPRLKVHIKDTKVLESFAANDIPSGGIFYRIPEPHPVGAEVMLEIHHPTSQDKFLIKASVGEVTEGGRRHRGMKLVLEPFDEEKSNAFQDFVSAQ